MTLSLDYDDTYTRDPVFWHEFIELAKKHGHRVVCVTARAPEHGAEVLENLVDVCYTSGRDKAQCADDNGFFVDVWIDDSPHMIGQLEF